MYIHDPSGSVIAHTQSNVFEGQDIHDASGSLVAQTQPNVLGGEDVS
ncbi:hypothetical protein [Neobacillus massiliamazoniensis]|nr:hypothetical protein [Neobacillus massiliamazoniensis]